MKREVAEFVSKCSVCQQVKAPKQKPAGLLQPLSVLEWKWENVSIDFITELPRTLRDFTMIWVVVDRLTKSAHFIPGKSTYTGSKWVQLYMSEIATIGWHHSRPYTENVVDPLFCWDEVGEQRLMGPELVQSTNEAIQKIRSLFLKVAPMKGVLRFERKGKLSPRFVGLFEILERIDPVAYIEQPIEVLAREVTMLRNREIPLVKVLWWNHKVEEAKWEREDDMKARYLKLFDPRLRHCGNLFVSVVIRITTLTYSRSRSPHFRSSSMSHATNRLPTVSTFNLVFFFSPIAAFANFLLLRTPPDVAQKNRFELLTFAAVRSSFSRRQVKQRKLAIRMSYRASRVELSRKPRIKPSCEPSLELQAEPSRAASRGLSRAASRAVSRAKLR
ncbi:retrotransposon protein, putative, Ty3-gypsy subclass [Cucumis melo var. makuwa]|uniref:Retrotransposon protein, putative, Ty3-gypsy subclass n=1 Tax=Cucumis melo var. makuwa TaxID=1194695 RepID=A0A5D3C0Q6_CUCMM|nr:retrotransposon protein, putative, Ty3-gypsy subclass [Cucumis melo var. makuwa]